MRQIRIGDTVHAFLDATLCGRVIEIFYRQTSPPNSLMAGGVPPAEAFAKVQLADGRVRVARTTELSVHNV